MSDVSLPNARSGDGNARRCPRAETLRRHGLWIFLISTAIMQASAQSPRDAAWDTDVPELVQELRNEAASVSDPHQGPTDLRAPGISITPAEIERFIILFDKSVSHERRLALVGKAGGILVEEFRLIEGSLAEVPADRVSLFASILESSQQVRRVEKDLYINWIGGFNAFPLPPASGDGSEKGQIIPWGIQRVKAPKAWAVTRGQSILVAVVDTGIDIRHPDLQVWGGFNAIDRSKPFQDDNGHGTHVAGIIGALDNDVGVVGIAPGAALFAVKVLNSQGSGYISDIIRGIQWCVESRMDIANLSFGAPQDSYAFGDAVQGAAAAGLILVAAAGNDGGPVQYPAAYPGAIAVSASDEKDAVADFSNRGPEIDFIAPGVGVLSTWLDGTYGYGTGTSMSSPHVAGLSALAVSAHGVWDVVAVQEYLKRSTTRFPGIPREQQGAGMIDAGRLATLPHGPLTSIEMGSKAAAKP